MTVHHPTLTGEGNVPAGTAVAQRALLVLLGTAALFVPAFSVSTFGVSHGITVPQFGGVFAFSIPVIGLAAVGMSLGGRSAARNAWIADVAVFAAVVLVTLLVANAYFSGMSQLSVADRQMSQMLGQHAQQVRLSSMMQVNLGAGAALLPLMVALSGWRAWRALGGRSR